MADISDVIWADGTHILCWRARLGQLARGASPAFDPDLAATWDTVTALIDLHARAEEAICEPAIYSTGSQGMTLARQARDVRQEIRAIIGETDCGPRPPAITQPAAAITAITRMALSPARMRRLGFWHWPTVGRSGGLAALLTRASRNCSARSATSPALPVVPAGPWPSGWRPTMPSAHRSAAGVAGAPTARSGARYAGVPISAPEPNRRLRLSQPGRPGARTIGKPARPRPCELVYEAGTGVTCCVVAARAHSC
jgi:hypothetical protein